MKFMLKKDGVDLFEDFVKGQEKITNPKFLNTYMLGVLSKHLKISHESWEKALKAVIKPQFVEKNIEVFNEATK